MVTLAPGHGPTLRWPSLSDAIDNVNNTANHAVNHAVYAMWVLVGSIPWFDVMRSVSCGIGAHLGVCVGV